MDELLPGNDDPRRRVIRDWLATHPNPTNVQLAESGYVAPHWPEPWGLGADPIHQLIIDDELARAGVSRPSNQIGIGWAAPTIIFAGTQEQKDRYVMPALTAEEIWCQLYSEPGAGSDLPSLTTRAVLDGDEWVVNGQKVWTSGAHLSDFGIVVTRTDPTVPKHKGLTMFIVDRKAPGMEVRPIKQMSGGSEFNEVFFTDVRVPAINLVGVEGNAFKQTMRQLEHERGGIDRLVSNYALYVIARERAGCLQGNCLRYCGECRRTAIAGAAGSRLQEHDGGSRNE